MMMIKLLSLRKNFLVPGKLKCTFVIMSQLTSDDKEEWDGDLDNENEIDKGFDGAREEK